MIQRQPLLQIQEHHQCHLHLGRRRQLALESSPRLSYAFVLRAPVECETVGPVGRKFRVHAKACIHATEPLGNCVWSAQQGMTGHRLRGSQPPGHLRD